jgi:hypothetical protein
MSQISFRYNYGRDFERHWRRRLNSSLRSTRNQSGLHVVVTHRFPAPKRYGWQIRPPAGLPVRESRFGFPSWEEASQAGRSALTQLLQEQ